MKKWVYIDYENMSGLKSLPKIDGQYFLFIGATQNTLSKTLVLSAQEHNGKFIEISGTVINTDKKSKSQILFAKNGKKIIFHLFHNTFHSKSQQLN